MTDLKSSKAPSPGGEEDSDDSMQVTMLGERERQAMGSTKVS